ncbi:interferon-induced very large GTPase 1 [Gigaspora margarita]|nr:interferon-induced very large GTPase 1 [Gigaspora margarita]
MKDKKFLKLFEPFKDGTTANSPPSEQYHNNVIDLYNSIIDNCKYSSNKKKNFSVWFSLINGYWDSISCENSSFKEIEKVYDFIEFGKQVARLKGTIDMAFLKHTEFIENKIRSIVCEWLLNKNLSVNSVNSKCEELIKMLDDIPEAKCQIDCEECKKLNKEIDELNKYLEKKNDEKSKEETHQTIDNYVASRRKPIYAKLKNMLESILMRNMFSKFIDRTLIAVLSTWKRLPDEKKLEEEANKIWDLLRKEVSTQNKGFINEEIDNIINEEYGTKWSSFFKIYKTGVIPELSDINAIRIDFIRSKRLEQNDVTKLKNEITRVIEDILCDINREEMLKIQDKWDNEKTPINVLDQMKNEYIEMIKLRLQYGHSHAYKGHLIGIYLLKAIHKKAKDAEALNRRCDVLSIPWIKNSETIRIKYFIELAEQVHDEKGQQYKETFNAEFDFVHKEIRNCKSCEDIKKFVNNYMKQVDGIDYQLNDKDNSIAEVFDLFHKAIMNELDAKGNSCYQLEESLTNLSEILEKRLGCTEPCFWCGALCWGERGHVEDSGETNIHHSSHQPGGLKGTIYIDTNKLVALTCHNQTDDQIVHYPGKTKKWDLAKERTLEPADDSELETNGCLRKDYHKIIRVLRQCLDDDIRNEDFCTAQGATGNGVKQGGWLKEE